MLGVASLVLGGIVGLLFVSWLIGRIRDGGSEQRESYRRHREAQRREPPVEVGETRTAAVEEFTTHHTGERRAVCKVEGFVVFVQDLPGDLEETDAIRIKILSFNRGRTSATATFLERA
ncbi:TRAM domain-containing protein [Natronococcus wangiae]|uniref:TRAM domain-containing protein n=1 Tax=Natronococcus wangiae TaxID=3068275 RepID=UPI00273FEB33|nr:RNA-binding protein [Natronococcus sp. AD5]